MADSDSQRKRAHYRAHHRGTKEMDIILGGFSDSELARLSADEIAVFEGLLALPDPEIDRLVKGAEPPRDFKILLMRIRRHCGFEG